MRRWGRGVVRLPNWRLHCGRQEIVEEAGVFQISERVESHFLPHGDAESLGEAAMDLALDDHWIDPRAAIIDCVKATDISDAGIDVDVDDADIGAERIGHV